LYYGLLTLVFLSRAFAPGIPADMKPSPLWFYGFLSNFWFAQRPASTDLALEVTWSLSVEEQFYLVWPLLIRLLPRRILASALLAVIAAGPLFRSLIAHDAQTLCHTLSRMDGLALGCLAALWWFSGRPRLPRHLGAVATAMWGGWLIIVWQGGFRFDGWGVPVFTYGLVPAATAVTILAVVSGQARLASRLLGLRPVVWIGRISFGLYLLHPSCFNFVHQFAAVVSPRLDATAGVGPWLWAGLAISLSLAMAATSYRMFEQRFLAWKDRLAPVSASSDRAILGLTVQHGHG
jgi:peptidoglycan/LPS O-acetylase OafA/YrhL